MRKSNFLTYRAMFLAVGTVGISVPAFADLTVNTEFPAGSTTTYEGSTLPANWPNSSVYGTAPAIVTGSNNGLGSPGEGISGNTTGGLSGSPVAETLTADKVEGETFTPITNFNLGGISFLLSGAGETTGDYSVHLLALPNTPTNIVKASAPSYTSYTPSTQSTGVDLLGAGSGDVFNYNGAGSPEITELDFSNGPTADDQVTLMAGTVYSFEFWGNDNVSATISVQRTSGADSNPTPYSGGAVFATSSSGAEAANSSAFRGATVGSGSVRQLVFAVYQAPASYNVATWTPAGGGTWSSNSNWSTSIPGNAQDAAYFGPSITTGSTVTIDGNHTVGDISFNSSNSYTIAPGTGGTIVLDDGGTAATAVIFDDAGNHTISAPLELTSNLTIKIGNTSTGTGGYTLAVTGNITDNPNGGGGLTVTGQGTVVLSGVNTYQGNGTTLNGGGELKLGSSTGVSSATSLYVASGTFDMAGFSPTVVDLYGNGTIDNLEGGSSTLTVLGGASSTYSGVIQNTAGTVGLAYAGTGTVTLTGANTYGGTTTVSSGTLIIGAAGSLPANNNVVNNGSLILTSNATISKITGNGALTVGTGSPAIVQLVSPNGSNTKSGNVDSVGSLSIGSGSTLDITNNTLLVNYGSGADPASTIRAELISGLNAASGTPWTGTGIISSVAAANPTTDTIGYADGGNALDSANTGVAAGTVEIKYTVAGDANLSGGVDLSDLVIVASDFGDSGADWAQGDVNYDGNVDLSDLVIVASNFGSSLSAVSTAAFSGSFQAEWKLALAEVHGADVVVPEPGVIALAVFGASGLLARRRR
jgi:fibronectin-binding autotransporter adhesin